MTNYSDRDRLILNHHLDTLRVGIATGIVYNSDYNTIKGDLNRILERAWDNLKTYHTPIAKAFDIVEMPLCPYLHLIPTIRKRINKILTETPGLEPFLTLVTEWEEYTALYNEAKPLVVKARKPSGKERVTPLRTLDNTGTCACCGKNVKLETGGVLYDHGFTIQWNFRNGNCFGVGYKPWEKSPEGAVAYVSVVRSEIAAREARLIALPDALELPDVTRPAGRDGKHTMVPRENTRFGYILNVTKANIESDIRHLNRIATEFDTRIKNWKEEPLPGDK